jgi:hypothetical protein
MAGKYDDIIDHEHYQSKKRPHMSMHDRAAQFSPFAALTGYSERVEEAQQAYFSQSDIEYVAEEDDYYGTHFDD